MQKTRKVPPPEYDYDDPMFDREDDYFCKRHIVSANFGLALSVDNLEERCSNTPYFKLVNNENDIDRVARLHFFDNGYEIGPDDSPKTVWHITIRNMKNIHECFDSETRELLAFVNHVRCTNWQVACFQWNAKGGLIPNTGDGMKAYLAGEYDADHVGDPTYVPSTTPIPKKWNTPLINPSFAIIKQALFVVDAYTRAAAFEVSYWFYHIHQLLRWNLIGRFQHAVKLKRKRYRAYLCKKATGVLPSLSEDDIDYGGAEDDYDEEWLLESVNLYAAIVLDQEFTKPPYQPYFVILSIDKTKEYRLHLLDDGVEHPIDRARELKLTRQDILKIKDELQTYEHGWFADGTNIWTEVKFEWNMAAYRRIKEKSLYSDYTNGALDMDYIDRRRYVPSTQPIPNWEIHFTDERND